MLEIMNGMNQKRPSVCQSNLLRSIRPVIKSIFAIIGTILFIITLYTIKFLTNVDDGSEDTLGVDVHPTIEDHKEESHEKGIDSPHVPSSSVDDNQDLEAEAVAMVPSSTVTDPTINLDPLLIWVPVITIIFQL